MTNDTLTRIRGARMVDGVIRAEVMDGPHTSLAQWFASDGEFHAWMIVALPEERDIDDDCDGPDHCYPGHPCPKCQVRAVEYWYKVDRQAQERIYKARKPYPPGTLYSFSCWCPHKKGHPTLDKARRCAKKHGFPFVVLLDGNGKQLGEWPADESPQLFGAP